MVESGFKGGDQAARDGRYYTRRGRDVGSYRKLILLLDEVGGRGYLPASSLIRQRIVGRRVRWGQRTLHRTTAWSAENVL